MVNPLTPQSDQLLISPYISSLNQKLWSWESRKWSPTYKALDFLHTNSPCPHPWKCIENRMENVHTDVKVKRVNALDSESRGLGQRFGWDSVLCSWARQHIDKTGIPSVWGGGGVGEFHNFLSLHATETGISCCCISHLPHVQTLPMCNSQLEFEQGFNWS